MVKEYIISQNLDDFGDLEEHNYTTFPVEIIGEAKASLFPDEDRVFAEVISHEEMGYVVMVEQGYLGFLSEDVCIPVNLHLPHRRKQ